MDNLNFEKPEDVGSWLVDRPAEWTQVVAVRAALRVYPLVLDGMLASNEELPFELRLDLVLQTFRANLVALITCRQPSVEVSSFVIYQAAADALEPFEQRYSGNSSSSLVSAVSAAKAAAYAAHFELASTSIADLAGLARAAADTASAAAAERGTGDLVLQAIAADCRRLSSEMLPDELIRQPLWPEEIREEDSFSANLPGWAREAFDRFTYSKWGETSGGNLIADWYRALVPFEGDRSESAFGEDVDVDIATLPDVFWRVTDQRSADDIWADIARVCRGETLPEIADPSEEFQSAEIIDVDDDPSDDNPEVEIVKDSDPGEKGQPAEPSGETESVAENPDADDDISADNSKKREVPANIDVAVQFDQFARKDELGRKRFAEVLATRISELHAGGGPDGLAVNLHAPWGAGKTTVLHFMKGFLEDEALPPEKRWVVVEFNAWQHEHRRPPWWPFLKTVKSQVSDRLIAQKKRQRAAEVRQKWRAWLFKAEAGPYLVMLFVVALLMALLWSGSSDVVKNIFGGIGSVLAVLATLTLYSRTAFFGSEKSANLFHDYASDPLEKLSVLFGEMVVAADAPVCIFIDDLDRCQNEFVVELLEGLQTSFRHRKVAYVVAADKFWIKTSFEDKYPSFCEKTSDRTQPLGYQFLEKIFQFNVPLPGMAGWKQRYLEARLGLIGEGVASQVQQSEEMEGGMDDILEGAGLSDVMDPSVADTAAEQREDQEVERLRGAIREQQPEGLTHEAVRTLSEGVAKGNTAYQAALALEYTSSSAARQEATHFLLRYLELLPDNPRVIKRIINAFGMAVATTILEQQALDYDVLTRWTILEQCYPAVADELTRDPDLADALLAFDADSGEELDGLPVALAAFCEKKMAARLLKDGATEVLTKAVIRRLTRGAVLPAEAA